MRKNHLLALLVICGLAAPALSVPVCPNIKIIAVKFPMGGQLDHEFSTALKNTLSQRGFEVIPEGTPQSESARLGVTGEINLWQSALGRVALRVGQTTLKVYDIPTGNVRLTITQPPPLLASQALTTAQYAEHVSDLIGELYCAAPISKRITTGTP